MNSTGTAVSAPDDWVYAVSWLMKTLRRLAARKKARASWEQHWGTYVIPQSPDPGPRPDPVPMTPSMVLMCDYCGEPMAKGEEFWVAAGGRQGELWHRACWQKEITR